MTSPLGDMVSTLVAEMSGKNDFSVVISEAQRAAVLRGVFQNFYGDFHGTDVEFDTGRVWCSKLPMLANLFPNSKVTACVREMPWVLDTWNDWSASSHSTPTGCSISIRTARCIRAPRR